MNKKILAVLLLGCCYQAHAISEYASVESRKAHPVKSKQSQYVQAKPSNELVLQMNAKIDQLQHEVMDMRGKLEVQNHEIERLNRRQRELYVELDRRVAAGSAAKKPHAPAVSTTANPKEQDLYNTARKQLRSKKYSVAKESFNLLLKSFPEGKFAANSEYWLGEIYLLEGENQKAKAAFEHLAAHYANSNKAPDALLKLGLMAKEQGKSANAKKYFERVKAEYPLSSASAIATQNLH